MFTGILLISYFTASVTSALTVQKLQQNITSIQDLQNQSIGTVKNTTAAEFLETTPAYTIYFDTIDDAYKALDEGTIRAIVYDSPALRYYMKTEGKGKVQVVGQMFAQQSYGIALQSNSPYRESINQALLKLKEKGTYEQIYEKWFGVN
jgi:ABC-type amino acid transport substrate-binding protein